MNDDAARAARTLVQRFLNGYPDEAAHHFESAPLPDVIGILSDAAPNRASAVIERMTPGVAAQTIETMEGAQLRPIVSAMDPSIAAATLSRIDEETRERILGSLEPSQAKELRALISYPPDSAGSLMDPQVLTFRPETTVEEALRRLRREHKTRIYDVFVASPAEGLIGSVPIQQIALSSAERPLVELAHPAPSVLTTASREEISELLETHKLTALAVVDLDNRLLGVIRHGTLLAAAQAEATLDIQTMVGASRDERALSKVSFAVKKRLPWLNINLATAFLAAGVVGLFEDTIARYTALAVLLPVVAGQSGNTGAQALAVTMRGLALREIRVRHWTKVTIKEVSVALLNGVAIAIVTSVVVYFWSGSFGLGLVIFASMILSMVAAGFAGAIIPMLLTALGQDPAQSSSIILTTITDVTGFFSFLGIATLLSSML